MTVNKTVNVENVAGNVNIGDSPEYNVGSVISDLLNELVYKPFEFDNVKRRPSSETILKISHNDLTSKSHIIKQYLEFSKEIEEAYDEVDRLVTFGKSTVLRHLNDLYCSALDSLDIDYLLGNIDIEKVREHSDFIIEFIIQKLRNIVFESKNTPAYKEQIDLGVNVVVAHAFIECIIMENPSK